jgi:hypothetical protein
VLFNITNARSCGLLGMTELVDRLPKRKVEFMFPFSIYTFIVSG